MFRVLPYGIESMLTNATAEIYVAGVSRRCKIDWIFGLLGVDRIEMMSTVAETFDGPDVNGKPALSPMTGDA